MSGGSKSYILKIAVIGDGGVGKTSLIRRYVEGQFREDYKMTIGASFFTKNVVAGDEKATLQLWDMVGEARFKFMAASFFRGTSGALIVFDVTRQATFKPGVFNWLDLIFKHAGRIPIVLVANKVDLIDQKEVDITDIEKFATKLECPYLETSAKTGENIDNVFNKLVPLVLGSFEEIKSVKKIESPAAEAPVSDKIKADNKWGVKTEQARILKEIEKSINQDLPRVERLSSESIGVTVGEGSLSGLGLYNSGLTAVPEYLTQLTTLKYLDLSGNQLKELPESLGNLKSLQELDLSNNQLTSLPENFGNFNKLINLNFYFNQLERLPETFRNLNSLEILNLSYNQLSAVPESILKLNSLQFIGLRNNQLTQLPMGLWRLKHLEDIQLHGNPWEGEWKEVVNKDVPGIFDFCRKHDTITLFCSHAEADFHNRSIPMEKIAGYLREQEEIYKVYYSEEAIQGGMSFEDFMRKYVPISHILLFFATENSLKSKPCQFELQLALDNQIPIIPILGPNLEWGNLNQIPLTEPTGESFQLSEVKGLYYRDDVTAFGAELYRHIHDLKRAVNMFDKELMRIDQFKLEFAELFSEFIKSSDSTSLLRENFDEIRLIFKQFKERSLPFLSLAKKVFEILN